MGISNNPRRQLAGWLMYDWANSAYVTTVAVAVLPAYFAGAMAPRGLAVGGTTLAATTLWGLVVGLTGLAVFLLAPLLGAVADFSASRKPFLLTCCALGSAATVGLFFLTPGAAGQAWLTLALFALAQTCFVAGNVFYDSFLPQVAQGHGGMDRVSGLGFACGYVGGGLHFALSLALISLHERLGLSADLAARLAMASAGLWWGGFALFTWRGLREGRPAQALPSHLAGAPRPLAYLRAGLGRVAASSRHIRGQRPLLLFLVAFLLYNDGIQTVISMATIYGKEELGFSTTLLMLTLLMIQVVGIPGSLLFGRLARRLTARRALMLSLAVWCVIALWGYVLTRPWEYLLLGSMVGLVLGGSQALSRSLYGAMIPSDASAEYFGYFSVVNKFSSILGPLAFAVLRHATGSSRSAVLMLMTFFVTGLYILWRLGKNGKQH